MSLFEGRLRLPWLPRGSACGGSGGGGGCGVDGEDWKVKSVVDGAEEASGVSSDVIILDVGGMTCGGCAAGMKRILENQHWTASGICCQRKSYNWDIYCMACI
ncbi:hypothetical protein EUGRSUZ_L00180 [Eucalyptus grandis]|uniref:Uncharacterized protein n=1 Tax=Eucalyptus grandis TaxID=71139 RepID=A0A058ZVX8_EUCGR|nr:hypothetical protein EUGRSUZ_L00180 [Eucalyptus grandis]